MRGNASDNAIVKAVLGVWEVYLLSPKSVQSW